MLPNRPQVRILPHAPINFYIEHRIVLKPNTTYINMKAELKTITPEWARKTLNEKNMGNRDMNLRYVDKLAAEILAGRWKVNGDTIRLNKDRLIDGQHRLAAVVQAGISVQSFVVEGLPSDVFDTIDVGKRRSPGDTLGALGEKNSYRLASALMLTDKYMTGRADKSVEYTNTELETLLAKYPDVRNSIQTSVGGKGIIPPSLVDTCHYIFSRKDRALADEFVVKLIKGTGLQEGDPFYALRERLVKNSVSKAKLSKAYMLALCIKAWNYTRRGISVRFLRWRDSGDLAEAFPVAI